MWQQAAERLPLFQFTFYHDSNDTVVYISLLVNKMNAEVE
jgi:hypothetical protein